MKYYLVEPTIENGKWVDLKDKKTLLSFKRFKELKRTIREMKLYVNGFKDNPVFTCQDRMLVYKNCNDVIKLDSQYLIIKLENGDTLDVSDVMYGKGITKLWQEIKDCRLASTWNLTSATLITLNLIN